MIQQHGTRIVVLRRDHSSETAAPPSADAMITDRPRVALMVKQADCQAVILFDPVKRVVANVHCGWRGNVQNILGKTVERMQREFGCRGTDILAAIGPSLGPCCAEFAEHEEIFPKDFSHFMVRENFFDLWAVSTQQLMESGIPKANVELAQACTRCRTDLFFSYRGERGHTGRTATIAMLT
jgi:hypothetical protein